MTRGHRPVLKACTSSSSPTGVSARTWLKVAVIPYEYYWTQGYSARGITLHDHCLCALDYKSCRPSHTTSDHDE